MPGYQERASILQDAAAMIVHMVCDRATPKQWAEWLRVPLEHAAGTANADLVDKLLKAGADGSAGWKGCNDQTLLHAGAEGGNKRVMSALMRAGAKEDMNTKAQAKRRTPLHLAVCGGQVAAAKVLMLAGADVNIVDADRQGPLHFAIRGGHVGLTEDLLLCGADPELKDSGGLFPIHLAIRLGQDETVLNLLNRGAQVNRVADNGAPPLYLAVLAGHPSTVKVLLDGGVDTAIPWYGDTPLHAAARLHNTDILAALVGSGADVEAGDELGFTPLHSSAGVNVGSCAGMRTLLQLGANVHATVPRRGSTALHFACQAGRLDAADLLLRWGADETALDGCRWTPSARIPRISEAADQDRPRLKRLSKLLAFAPQDRAWRRRGMLVLCRAHPGRLRMVVEIPDTAEACGQRQGRASPRARRSQVKVEVTMGGARNGGADGAGSSVGGGRRAACQRSGGGGGGFDSVAAWLMALRDEDVFRKIVEFL